MHWPLIMYSMWSVCTLLQIWWKVSSCQSVYIIHLSISSRLCLIGLCTCATDWRGGGYSGTSLWKNTLVWMIGCDWQRNQLRPQIPAMCYTPQQKRNCRSLRWNGHHAISTFLHVETWPRTYIFKKSVSVFWLTETWQTFWHGLKWRWLS